MLPLLPLSLKSSGLPVSDQASAMNHHCVRLSIYLGIAASDTALIIQILH